ncbi:peptide/nickel transport system ATP-binding protein [Caldicoprobacter guelmensis]|uniref:ABC transporter ATP-binding protein n=1 Tax=Caldicoprobacter guelmensis TaxID=1170224 RepID=UPI001958DAD6|nr:ABC transporter ATP-binding protein [Caldicoprobacter guelmensis]MBM7583355.1 peptide/nickel transport system ATP-binding protein [Caldicoprobacter guelmensis]
MQENGKLLELKNVSKIFKIGGLILGTKLRAVDKVNLSIDSKKPVIVSIVGESGSGKTTLAKMVLRLIEPSEGQILLNKKDITKLKKSEELLEYRKIVQPIFQNPFAAFNNLRRVSSYLYDTAYNICGAKNKEEANKMISEVLEAVGLSFEKVIGRYPKQFSGGELQRVSVARALLPRPKLLVADEPVSMVDASIRMNIMNLFKALRDEYNVSCLYITHDLSTAYYVSDFIAIMFRGNIIEYGASDLVLTQPLHPYTELLISSIPRVDKKWEEDIKLSGIEVKEYESIGCKFALRCPYVMDICKKSRPKVVKTDDGREVMCFKYEGKELEDE